MKKLALVLGGGGAKGYCHIGILKVLEKNGIKPDLIVGTSMGSLVGGYYAMGKTIEELEQTALRFKRKNFVDFDILGFFRKGLIGGRRLDKLMDLLFGDTKQEDTKIPFVCVAANLENGKQYNLEKGLLKRNIKASIAVPTLFKAVEVDGKYLVDGGTVDNVPDDIARRMMPDAVILSVDALGNYSPEKYPVKLVGILVNMITLMQVAHSAKYNCSDIFIKVTQKKIKQSDFEKKQAIVSIRLGEQAMENEIDNLKKILKG
ncbi:MAG: patatin-like phospholipase family protein [Clostridia bacterium]|nr:patatin-like phospholipase family protein [Clostridia bacterium]